MKYQKKNQTDTLKHKCFNCSNSVFALPIKNLRYKKNKNF